MNAAGCFRVFSGSFDPERDEQAGVLLQNQTLLNALNPSELQRGVASEDTGAPVELTSLRWAWLHLSRYGELQRPDIDKRPNCLYRVRKRRSMGERAKKPGQSQHVTSTSSSLPATREFPEVFHELELHGTDDLSLNREMLHALVRTEQRMNEHTANAIHLHRRAQWAIYKGNGSIYQRYLLNQAYQNTLKTSFYTHLELMCGFIVNTEIMQPTKRFPLQEASLIADTSGVGGGNSMVGDESLDEL